MIEKNGTSEVEALCNLASDYYQQGRCAEALAAVEQAAQLDPLAGMPHLIQFQVHYDAKRYSEALQCLRQVSKSPEFQIPQVLLNSLIDEVLPLKLPETALAALDLLVQLYPENPETCERQYLVNRSVGNWDQALLDLDAMLELDPSLNETTNKLHVNQNFLTKRFRLEEEIRILSLKCSEALNKISTPNLGCRGTCSAAAKLISIGQLRAAIERLRLTLKVHSNDSLTRYVLACTLASLGKINGHREVLLEAYELLQSILSIDSSIAIVYQQQAELIGSLHGRSSESLAVPLACHFKAAQLDPSFPEPLRDIGILMQYQGKVLRSYPFFAEYLRLKEEIAQAHPLGKLGLRILGEGNAYAIGHMSDMPAALAMAKILGWIPDYKMIWLAPPGRVANLSLLEYYKPYYDIVSEPHRIRELTPLLPCLEIDTAFFKMPSGLTLNTRIAHSAISQAWLDQGREPLFKLTPTHFERGQECLQKLGLPKGAWFVAAHVREAGFKNQANCPYNGHRLATASNFFEAFKRITDAGGWVVRMGEPSMSKLPELPNVIDYAHSEHKSDWMDIFLCGAARFYLGTSAGLKIVPPLFGTPSIITNVSPTCYRHGHKNLFLPKLLWNNAEKRYLSFGEMFQPPIYDQENGVLLQELGIVSVENTNEEILEVVQEMIDKLSGTNIYTQEDEKMQQSYMSLCPPQGQFFLNRIGREFLKRHRNLLPS